MASANAYEWGTWQYLAKSPIDLNSEMATTILGIYPTNTLWRYEKTVSTDFFKALLIIVKDLERGNLCLSIRN